MDYRNGYLWSQCVPTKWFIWLCSHIGLAWDLKRIPKNEIQKGQFQQVERKMDFQQQGISWGTPSDELPVLDFLRFVEMVQEGHSLILMDGIAHDVSLFMDQHPGGANYLRNYIGKNGTKAFHGGWNPCSFERGH
ncbi:uncharacterized protein N7529_000276 [Penicillium soppii]|jgi:stearoyl-CoA desaturase (delta-9 desaturase)|uniref:uncharacterized protein n=1 Tax=Penicillium soppii TaxID=69789 RepID=UPI002549AC93|nr:uncharacterized protein N7529_000276 [Penicillium soppii]KAJ5881604.1 hypothetical protein N7529_000276 [Penicillium soppii]